MKVYIWASACISPQNTFDAINFLDEIVEYNTNRLTAIEPDYAEFIDTKQVRRMSRVIKMGVAAAKKCLKSASVEMPGAIITGTALGCMEDTVTFLTRIIEQQEELLPPTAFIQSTHNTVAAQIALLLKCHHYNQTFVHKGISFESALIDAVMLLKEQEADNILVGGIEETVEASFKILSRLGVYKRQPVSNLALYANKSKGSVSGEGAVFFLLSDKKSNDNLAELIAVKTFYKPANIDEGIKEFLKFNSINIKDIDLVITGRNGDIRNDALYDGLSNSLFKGIALANYKHLCGEYPVSSSFALWITAGIVKKGVVPAAVVERGPAQSPKKILIYNHYLQKYHSLMLVAAI